MFKIKQQTQVAQKLVRAFSTGEKWGIGSTPSSTVSGGSMGTRKSEMKIQYEKVELGKNANPKDFS